MSSNPSWKKSNQNKTFNNVKIDILDYQDGKWKDVNTIQTIVLLIILNYHSKRFNSILILCVTDMLSSSM